MPISIISPTSRPSLPTRACGRRSHGVDPRRPSRRGWLPLIVLSLPLLAGCSFHASVSTRTGDDAEPPPESQPTETQPAATAEPTGEPAATDSASAPAAPDKADVTVVGKKLEAPGPVVFAPDSAELLAGSGSEQVLEEVRKYLEQNARVTRLRIEGHTNNVRPEDQSLELSGQRASTVKQWLIARGINEGRLVAVGFGQAQPVASNADPVGQAENERIAFRIAELDGKPYLGADPLAGGKEFP